MRETGCGCPVDTSVRSTEAPTEAAAETLNPYELPHASCGTQSFFAPWSGAETLTAAPQSHSLYPPLAAVVLCAPQTFEVRVQIKKKTDLSIWSGADVHNTSSSPSVHIHPFIPHTVPQIHNVKHR